MCSLSPVPRPLPRPAAYQERAELAAGRRHLEARQALYAELQTQLDNCPESVREQLQEQLRRVSSTSPPTPGPRGPPAQKEERRAVGRDHLAPAVPAGHQGRCCGLEGTGKVGGISAPGCDARERGKAKQSRGGWVGAGFFPNFLGPGPLQLMPLRPGLPGPEWHC